MERQKHKGKSKISCYHRNKNYFGCRMSLRIHLLYQYVGGRFPNIGYDIYLDCVFSLQFFSTPADYVEHSHFASAASKQNCVNAK